MPDTRQYFTADEVAALPAAHMPLLVLSDNQKSFFSWAIKAHQDGAYNHLCWMIRPGYVISQDWLLRERPITDYTRWHRLKFWTCDKWTPADRAAIIMKLQTAAARPWYRRLYDPLQILGKFVHLDWIQIPGTVKICSDWADILGDSDPHWHQGMHFSPPEVNRLLEVSPRYRVYGRYVVD